MRWKIAVFILVMGLFFTACIGPAKEKVYYEAQKKLSGIQNYQCNAVIEVRQGDQVREYVFQQTFAYPNQYRLELLEPQELKGNLTVSNGKTAWIHNPSIGQTMRLAPFDHSHEQMLFLGYFMEHFYNAEEAVLEERKVDSKREIGITIPLGGRNEVFHQQRLWIDQGKLTPQSLEILDQEGRLKFKVTYQNFQTNIDLDEGLFYIDQGDQ